MTLTKRTSFGKDNKCGIGNKESIRLRISEDNNKNLKLLAAIPNLYEKLLQNDLSKSSIATSETHGDQNRSLLRTIV